jgi:hypothetical protein
VCVTYVHSSSDANSCSPSPETACILWNPKFHYHVQNSLPCVCTMRKMNPVHALLSYLFKIHFSILSVPKSSKCSLSVRFPHNNLVCNSFLLYDYLNIIWWVLIMKLLIVRSSPGSFYFLPQRHSYHPQQPVLECCLCSVPASTHVFMKADTMFLFTWDESRQLISCWEWATEELVSWS